MSDNIDNEKLGINDDSNITENDEKVINTHKTEKNKNFNSQESSKLSNNNNCFSPDKSKKKPIIEKKSVATKQKMTNNKSSDTDSSNKKLDQKKKKIVDYKNSINIKIDTENDISMSKESERSDSIELDVMNSDKRSDLLDISERNNSIDKVETFNICDDVTYNEAKKNSDDSDTTKDANSSKIVHDKLVMNKFFKAGEILLKENPLYPLYYSSDGNQTDNTKNESFPIDSEIVFSKNHSENSYKENIKSESSLRGNEKNKAAKKSISKNEKRKKTNTSDSKISGTPIKIENSANNKPKTSSKNKKIPASPNCNSTYKEKSNSVSKNHENVESKKSEKKPKKKNANKQLKLEKNHKKDKALIDQTIVITPQSKKKTNEKINTDEVNSSPMIDSNMAVCSKSSSTNVQSNFLDKDKIIDSQILSKIDVKKHKTLSKNDGTFITELTNEDTCNANSNLTESNHSPNLINQYPTIGHNGYPNNDEIALKVAGDEISHVRRKSFLLSHSNFSNKNTNRLIASNPNTYKSNLDAKNAQSELEKVCEDEKSESISNDFEYVNNNKKDKDMIQSMFLSFNESNNNNQTTEYSNFIDIKVNLRDTELLDNEIFESNQIENLSKYDWNLEFKTLVNVFNAKLITSNNVSVINAKIELLDSRFSDLDFVKHNELLVEIKVDNMYKIIGDIKLLKFDIMNVEFSRKFANHLIHCLKNLSLQKDYINAVKRTERPIYQIFNFFANKFFDIYSSYIQANPANNEWSYEEQKKLENGLIWFKNYSCLRERWRRIADYVYTKSLIECVERYNYCHDIVKTFAQIDQVNQKNDLVNLNQENSVFDLSDKKLNLTKKKNIFSDESVLYQFELISLETKNILGMIIETLDVQIKCHECNTISGFSMNFSDIEKEFNENHYRVNCDSCNNVIHFENKSMLTGNGITTIFCLIRIAACDLLSHNNIKASVICLECNTKNQILINKHGEGRLDCRKCYSKLYFKFEDARFDLSECESSCHGIKKLRSAVKTSSKLDKVILGKPLKNLGACKHYKKSFKHFIFECCNLAYPCNECHDAATNHVADALAKKIICGFCSKKQDAANPVCACGKRLSNVMTNHWEGGRGCRNKVLLSRKDRRKYRH